MVYKRLKDIPIRLRGKVAIKLHMGDKGTTTHISPQDVRVLIEKIEAGSGKPFLVDTSVLYPGPRYTPEGYRRIARENGFGNFKVVIAEEYKKVKGVSVAKDILEADSLFVLTHATGHVSMGFAGAIKNLGMGGVSREEKRKIHAPCRPRYDESVCTACGSCVEACPFGLLRLQNELKLELRDCPACGRCIKACGSGALWKPAGAMVKTFELLTRAAKAVVSPFERSEIAYVTVLKSITEFCDCSKECGSIVCKDIGYLSGEDPLKLDIKAVELIRERNPKAFDFELWSEFEKVAKKCWIRR